jgi:hypothetical protein
MNNVNAAEMQKFVSALQKDPSIGKKNKRVTGAWSFEDSSSEARRW